MPSATLLGQSVVSGLLAGGLYGLLALGLSLSWGLLRLVNIAHFALALLGAYLTYQLGQVLHMAPWVAAAVVVTHRRHAFLLSGVAAAYAAVAGAFIALISTLAPTQIWTWLGVVFAVVIIGGLGNPVGALLAGFLVGVSESVTMAVAAPAWAPLVSFSILILVLVLRPER